MSMTDFISEIKSKGVAKESHFRCEILPPKFLLNSSIELANKLEFYVERVQLPEFALATMTIKDNGLNREVVYDKLYGSISPVFICDQKMEVKTFFDKWISGISKNKGGVFDYPTNYYSPSITIQQLNSMKEVVYEVVFSNAYPKIVNDAYLSAGGKNYLVFQVEFTYEAWDSYLIGGTTNDNERIIQ